MLKDNTLKTLQAHNLKGKPFLAICFLSTLLKSKYLSICSLINRAPYLCDTLNSPQADSWNRGFFKGISNPHRQSREGEEREGVQRGEGRIHKHPLLCWAWKAPKPQENPLQQSFKRIKKETSVVLYLAVSVKCQIKIISQCYYSKKADKELKRGNFETCPKSSLSSEHETVSACGFTGQKNLHLPQSAEGACENCTKDLKPTQKILASSGFGAQEPQNVTLRLMWLFWSHAGILAKPPCVSSV